MVLREVGEHRGRDVDARGALELQRVRGDLHRARDVARVEHLAEEPLQIERLGRRPGQRRFLAAHHGLDRAEQPGSQSRALQQRAGEERRRGLAVGPGDARDPQRGGRVAVEARRGERHRGPHVRHDDLGHAEPQRALDDQGDSPARDRVGGEVMPVAGEPGHAEEQGAFSDEPVVEGQARDDHIGAVPEQLAERHASGSLRASAAARMVGVPIVEDPEHSERRTLVDPDGLPIARFVHVERDGRTDRGPARARRRGRACAAVRAQRAARDAGRRPGGPRARARRRGRQAPPALARVLARPAGAAGDPRGVRAHPGRPAGGRAAARLSRRLRARAPGPDGGARGGSGTSRASSPGSSGRCSPAAASRSPTGPSWARS